MVGNHTQGLQCLCNRSLCSKGNTLQSITDVFVLPSSRRKTKITWKLPGLTALLLVKDNIFVQRDTQA